MQPDQRCYQSEPADMCARSRTLLVDEVSYELILEVACLHARGFGGLGIVIRGLDSLIWIHLQRGHCARCERGREDVGACVFTSNALTAWTECTAVTRAAPLPQERLLTS